MSVIHAKTFEYNTRSADVFELSVQEASDVAGGPEQGYNARFGTAERSAPMSKTRISEYENWPIGRNTRKPSLAVLDNLAQLYGTTRRPLTDHHDWARAT